MVLHSISMRLRIHLLSQFSIDAGPQLDQEAVAAYCKVFAEFRPLYSHGFRVRSLYSNDIT